MTVDTFFMTNTELAKKAGISRSYLYKKAKRIGLKLDGEYTKKDIEHLKKAKIQESVSSKRKNETGRRRETGDANQQLTPLESELKGQLVELRKQLSVKDNQLKTKDKQLEKAQQLTDQAQRLQADLQKQLESKTQELLTVSEQKKGFWARLFDK